MSKVYITIKIETEADGVYDNTLEGILFQQVGEPIYGVFDLSENCALLANSIELISVEVS